MTGYPVARVLSLGHAKYCKADIVADKIEEYFTCIVSELKLECFESAQPHSS